VSVYGNGGRLECEKIYNQSLILAKTNTQLQPKIGQPIKVSLFSLRGGFKTNNGTGTAFYRFTGKGSQNIAAIYVYAEMHQGKWQIKEESAGIATPGSKETVLLLYGQLGHIHFKV
jgi:hypothetical protein